MRGFIPNLHEFWAKYLQALFRGVHQVFSPWTTAPEDCSQLPKSKTCSGLDTCKGALKVAQIYNPEPQTVRIREASKW